jgi:hypothetical protein
MALGLVGAAVPPPRRLKPDRGVSTGCNGAVQSQGSAPIGNSAGKLRNNGATINDDSGSSKEAMNTKYTCISY